MAILRFAGLFLFFALAHGRILTTGNLRLHKKVRASKKIRRATQAGADQTDLGRARGNKATVSWSRVWTVA